MSVDDAAAQTDLAVVQHSALAGCHGPLGVWKGQVNDRGALGLKVAGCIALPIACFGGDGAKVVGGRWLAGYPAHIKGAQLFGEQPRVVVSLHGPQGIARHVFACDEPWCRALVPWF